MVDETGEILKSHFSLPLNDQWQHALLKQLCVRSSSSKLTYQLRLSLTCGLGSSRFNHPLPFFTALHQYVYRGPPKQQRPLAQQCTKIMFKRCDCSWRISIHFVGLCALAVSRLPPETQNFARSFSFEQAI